MYYFKNESYDQNVVDDFFYYRYHHDEKDEKKGEENDFFDHFYPEKKKKKRKTDFFFYLSNIHLMNEFYIHKYVVYILLTYSKKEQDLNGSSKKHEEKLYQNKHHQFL
jgi:hypothetical protein